MPRHTRTNDTTESDTAHGVWKHIASRHSFLDLTHSEQPVTSHSVVTAWAAFHACLPVSHVSLDRMAKRIDAFIDVVKPSPCVRSHIVENLLRHKGISDEARGRAISKLSVSGEIGLCLAREHPTCDFISIYDTPSTSSDVSMLHYIREGTCHTFRYRIPRERVRFECNSRFPPAGYWKGRNETFVVLMNTTDETIILATLSGMVVSAPSSKLYDLLCSEIL